LGHDGLLFEAERNNLEKAARLPSEARVVRLVEAFVDEQYGGCYCLVTEPLCDIGSLEDVFTSPLRLGYTLPKAMRWALQVAETLHMLHTADYVRLYHGDVNPRNVLLKRDADGHMEAVLGDLGIAVHNHPFGMAEKDLVMEKYSASVAPEMRARSDRAFDDRADVWSWGVLVIDLLQRRIVEDEVRRRKPDLVERLDTKHNHATYKRCLLWASFRLRWMRLAPTQTNSAKP
jgi:hypothetical protein